jgi:SAM-dependent methyltransferase
MQVQWGLLPQPEHFDHHIDLFYQWVATRSALWVERGVFGSLALQGGSVLELACGDGFNARNFYSLRSARIVACDIDAKAIGTARRKNSAPNIEYLVADIRADMPVGTFENVTWDGSIEHFSLSEIESILGQIKTRLTADGVLSGYTIVAKPDGAKSLSHHKHEFSGKDDLLVVLRPHFEHVTIFETQYPSRANLYFWASDGCVPFRSHWPWVVTEDDLP